MVEPIIKESKINFDDTVKLIEELLDAEGFALMASKNIDEVIKNKLGVKDFSRYTIILACKPELAKAALDVSKMSGFLFPCSFVVYERRGQNYDRPCFHNENNPGYRAFTTIKNGAGH